MQSACSLSLVSVFAGTASRGGVHTDTQRDTRSEIKGARSTDMQGRPAGDTASPQLAEEQPGGAGTHAWNWQGLAGGHGGGQSHQVPEEGPTVRRPGGIWDVSSSSSGIPSMSSSSASASWRSWGNSSSYAADKEEGNSSADSPGTGSAGTRNPTQLVAKHAAQAAGWFGISGDETPRTARAPGLKKGSYWWEWQADSDGTTSVTTTPPYTRHVHLDCDPTPPFRDCVMKCQAENQSKASAGANSAAEEQRRRRTGEPSALGSYEYGNLRSCYQSCRQKWIDADLPGCLRQDGTKVEGVPPVEAFRSSTTTTTTTSTTTEGPPPQNGYTAGAPWEREENKDSSSFWSRMTGKNAPSDSAGETPAANTPQEQKVRRLEHGMRICA